jgi:tRNA 2-selenouridine synthase
MIEKIEAEEFLERSRFVPMVDVRSPKEYRQGHLAGSVNLPLFDDDERAQVGTIYKNSGRDAAVFRGLELAGPKLADFIRVVQKIAPKKEVLVHCWRGGMRSEHMAWLFVQCGYKTAVVTGGYKACRKFIRESFSRDARVVILGGNTGSGKTAILYALRDAKQQVLDLEAIAHHKGSVFGAMGQEPQPTNEQFENNIFACWTLMDPSKTIWIEDESRMIGNVSIPDPLFDKMSNAPMILVEADTPARIKRLVAEYASFPADDLKDAIRRISEKLGGTRTGEAMNRIDQKDFYAVAELVLEYYDKSYAHAIARRINPDVTRIKSDGTPEKAAARILEFMNSLIPCTPSPPGEGDGG